MRATVIMGCRTEQYRSVERGLRAMDTEILTDGGSIISYGSKREDDTPLEFDILFACTFI